MGSSHHFLKMKFTNAAIVAAVQAGFVQERTTDFSDVPFCIGCKDATIGQFPWQVSLQTTGHFCGGSMISDTAIATAAHCRKASYFIVAGTIDNQAGQKIQTNIFIGHPEYNGQKIIKDCAVGKVTSPFTISDNAKPIPLVNPSETRPVDGHPLVTSGYGYYQVGAGGRPISQVSRYLKWSDMKYVSVARCKQIWAGQIIDESVICADNDDVSICSGGSGGPLVIEEEGESRLIGFTSWAHVYCNVNGRPQGWANAQWPKYNAWVRENAGLN